jgi:aminoglycoside 3-N-acetyltransferase
MGIGRNDTLLIHSSMKSIGEVEGRADTVLDAFMDYLSPDGLLILPTHTWAIMGKDTDTYDPAETPSCVGILTNLFMKRPGVFRSLNPTHSVAAAGKGAEEFVRGEERFHTPLARGGCWYRLMERGAKIMFLGCPLSRNTFLHGVEEWCGIENRLTAKPAEYKIKLPEGRVISHPTFRHEAPVPNVSENYVKMEPLFLREGAAYEGKFGDARCVIGSAPEMYEITARCLRENPDLFLDENPVEPA